MKKLNFKTATKNTFYEISDESAQSLLPQLTAKLIDLGLKDPESTSITMHYEIGPEFNGHILRVEAKNSSLAYNIPLFVFDEGNAPYYLKMVADGNSFTVLDDNMDNIQRLPSLEEAMIQLVKITNVRAARKDISLDRLTTSDITDIRNDTKLQAEALELFRDALIGHDRETISFQKYALDADETGLFLTISSDESIVHTLCLDIDVDEDEDGDDFGDVRIRPHSGIYSIFSETLDGEPLGLQHLSLSEALSKLGDRANLKVLKAEQFEAEMIKFKQCFSDKSDITQSLAKVKSILTDTFTNVTRIYDVTSDVESAFNITFKIAEPETKNHTRHLKCALVTKENQHLALFSSEFIVTEQYFDETTQTALNDIDSACGGSMQFCFIAMYDHIVDILIKDI